MAGINFKFKIDDKFTPDFKRRVKQVDGIVRDAFQVFVKHTPKKTGNARRKTTLKGKQIEANYPYAQRLDEGYSDQSPEGMTEPTNEFMEKEFRRIFG